MKIRILLTILLFMGVAAIGASDVSFSYPDTRVSIESIQDSFPSVTPYRIQRFLTQWAPLGQAEHTMMLDESAAIVQLESVYRMSVAQTDQVRRQSRPTVALVSDPANPVYGFTRMYQMDTSVAPPAEVLLEAHQFGLGASISQQLPTAGSLDVTARHAVSFSSRDGAPFQWQQSPVLSVSLQQPLGIGERLLDFSYGRQVLEKQLMAQQQAYATLQQTRQDVFLQTLRLMSTREALLEGRWLLSQQVVLQQQVVTRGELDLQAGLISRTQREQQQLTLRTLRSQVSQLDLEIATIEATLRTFAGPDSGEHTITAEEMMVAFRSLTSYADGAFPRDLMTLQQALESDADYMKAQRDLDIALLEKRLGNPADAPWFSIAMQLSPHAPSDTSFGASVNKLFTASKPEVSVSVSFRAGDLSRSLSRTTDAITQEAVVQATSARDSARQAVEDALLGYQRTVDTELNALAIRMQEYELAHNAFEVASIRGQAGLLDSSAVRRAELGVYEAAFAMLQQLRSITVLNYEITHALGLMK